MRYGEHYWRLVARARGRAVEGYFERHHVVPRCLGGLDTEENLVSLTAAEHYVAHQLLAKLYPWHVGLTYAAVKMSVKVSGRKAYEWLRRKNAVLMKGNTRALGATRSAETREKMSFAQRGRRCKPFTDEHRANLASAAKGRKLAPRSAAHCANLSVAKMGKKCPWVADSNRRRAKRGAP